jgi:drug/metabolite transporter (DMT)-like permease
VPHAATGDCERVRPGLIGQPVNTASSGAYLAAAAWVWFRRPPRRARWAAALAAVGLGSIGYHGPGTRSGKALHDGALLALVPVVVGAATRPNRRLATAAAIGASSAVLHAGTRTGARACHPDSVWQGHGLWHVSSAVAIALLADGDRSR